MSILDPSWKYTPSTATDISVTLKRHGFKRTTEAEREARKKRHDVPPANVTKLPVKARK